MDCHWVRTSDLNLPYSNNFITALNGLESAIVGKLLAGSSAQMVGLNHYHSAGYPAGKFGVLFDFEHKLVDDFQPTPLLLVFRLTTKLRLTIPT